MLDHYQDGKRMGSGTLIWQARQDQAAGLIDYKEFLDIVAASAPSFITTVPRLSVALSPRPPVQEGAWLRRQVTLAARPSKR